MICQGMGIGRLCIDSLCILQDFLSDCEHEASQMRNVYRSPLLTLAVHSAKSCQELSFVKPS